ncbi:hypothetical protein GGR50DRAFT_157170 [Xylaria sp. CBS 124048]|nr:hypothetical protein GGR50DRAFT_157170 [Xylaria sp. CBS 124048]
MMYPPTRPAGRPSPVNGSPSSQVQGPRQQYSSMPSSSSQAIPRTTDQDAVAKAAPRDPSTPTEAGPVATTSSNDPRPSSAEVSEDRVSSTLDGHDDFDTAVLRKGKKPVRGAIPEEWRQAASKPPVPDTDESQGYEKSAGQVSDVKGKSKMVYANTHHEAGQDRSPMDNKHPIGPVSRQSEDFASTKAVEVPPLPRSPERKAPNIAGQNVTLRLPASAVHAPMYTRRISSGGHRHPSMLGWSEPFPEYRDLMSGRQPVQTPARRIGHNKGLGSIASVSSSTSTATFGRKVPEVPGPKEEDDRTPTRANPVGAPSPRISEKPPSESKSTDKNATQAKTRQGSPLKASHTEDTGATDTIKPTSTKEKKKRRGGKQGKQGKQDKQAQTSTAPETSTAQTSDTLFKPEQRDNLPPAAKDKSSTSSSSKHDTPKVTKEDKQNMIAPPSEKKTPSLVTEDTTRTTNVAKVPAKGIETSPVNVDKTKKASTAMKTTTAKSKSSTPVQPKESSAATDVKSKMDRPKSRTDLTSSGSSSSNASSGSRSGKKKGYRPARQKQARPDAAKAQAADSASQKADGLAVLPKFPIIPTSILPATPANRPHRFAPPPKQTKVPGRKVLSAPTSPPGHKGDGCSSKEFKP